MRVLFIKSPVSKLDNIQDYLIPPWADVIRPPYRGCPVNVERYDYIVVYNYVHYTLFRHDCCLADAYQRVPVLGFEVMDSEEPSKIWPMILSRLEGLLLLSKYQHKLFSSFARFPIIDVIYPRYDWVKRVVKSERVRAAVEPISDRYIVLAFIDSNPVREGADRIAWLLKRSVKSRSFGVLLKMTPDVCRVRDGRPYTGVRVLDEAIQECLGKSCVVICDFLPRGEYLDLYRVSTVVFHPSSIGAFEAHLAEAMAMLKPVICAGPLCREMTGYEAGVAERVCLEPWALEDRYLYERICGYMLRVPLPIGRLVNRYERIFDEQYDMMMFWSGRGVGRLVEDWRRIEDKIAEYFK